MSGVQAQVRVVVAEDDDPLAELIRSVLEDDGRFDVRGVAHTGDEAVALVGETHPDVVLMDIAMPSCDGIEATRMIHELNPVQHVVIYTGSDDWENLARVEDAGAVGFLHKDAVPTDELADALYVLHTNYEHHVPDPD